MSGRKLLRCNMFDDATGEPLSASHHDHDSCSYSHPSERTWDTARPSKPPPFIPDPLPLGKSKSSASSSSFTPSFSQLRPSAAPKKTVRCNRFDHDTAEPLASTHSDKWDAAKCKYAHPSEPDWDTASRSPYVFVPEGDYGRTEKTVKCNRFDADTGARLSAKHTDAGDARYCTYAHPSERVWHSCRKGASFRPDPGFPRDGDAPFASETRQRSDSASDTTTRDAVEAFQLGRSDSGWGARRASIRSADAPDLSSAVPASPASSSVPSTPRRDAAIPSGPRADRHHDRSLSQSHSRVHSNSFAAPAAPASPAPSTPASTSTPSITTSASVTASTNPTSVSTPTTTTFSPPAVTAMTTTTRTTAAETSPRWNDTSLPTPVPTVKAASKYAYTSAPKFVPASISASTSASASIPTATTSTPTPTPTPTPAASTSTSKWKPIGSSTKPKRADSFPSDSSNSKASKTKSNSLSTFFEIEVENRAAPEANKRTEMVAYLSEVERDRKAHQAQSSGLSAASKGKKRAREDEGLGLTIDVDSAEKEADAYCPALPPEGGDAMVEDGDQAEQEDNVDYAALARETAIYRADLISQIIKLSNTLADLKENSSEEPHRYHNEATRDAHEKDVQSLVTEMKRILTRLEDPASVTDVHAVEDLRKQLDQLLLSSQSSRQEARPADLQDANRFIKAHNTAAIASIETPLSALQPLVDEAEDKVRIRSAQLRFERQRALDTFVSATHAQVKAHDLADAEKDISIQAAYAEHVDPAARDQAAIKQMEDCLRDLDREYEGISDETKQLLGRLASAEAEMAAASRRTQEIIRTANKSIAAGKLDGASTTSPGPQVVRNAQEAVKLKVQNDLNEMIGVHNSHALKDREELAMEVVAAIHRSNQVSVMLAEWMSRHQRAKGK